MNKRYHAGRLQKQFILFTVLLLIVLQITFQISNRIARNAMEESSKDSFENVLLQIDSRLEEMVTDISSECTVLTYNPTVIDYVYGDAEKKAALQKDMLSVLGNFLQMSKKSVQGIGIYNKDQELLIAYGSDSALKKQLAGSVEQITYSDVIEKADGEKIYTVSIPIYNLDSFHYQEIAGICVLQMSTEKFEAILDEYVVVGKSEVVITDSQNHILAYRGWEENKPVSYQPENTDNEFMMWEMKVDISGWKLISRVSTENVQMYMDKIQLINHLTYILIVVLIAVFLVFSYHFILSPILGINTFIKKHVEEPDSRLKLHTNNEIQDLADNLNEMLDEKERLDDQHKEMQERIYAMEIAQKQAEIMMYRSQINPHFLYNTLECIRSMAYYYKIQGIVDITMALSNMFRYSIKGKEIVALSEEVKHMKEYATIIRYRFMNRIRIEMEIKDELLETKIIKFILQPIVENAVFHGLERCSRQGEVKIMIAEENCEYLCISIRDNGCGMENEKLQELKRGLYQDQETDGVGLKNVYRRLKLVYGEKIRFEIRSQMGAGTEIIMVIPKL